KTVMRGGFNLHTGSYSEGCVTVESDTSWWNPITTYPESSPYAQLRQMLDNTSPLSYKGSSYRGRLTVKYDTRKVFMLNDSDGLAFFFSRPLCLLLSLQ